MLACGRSEMIFYFFRISFCCAFCDGWCVNRFKVFFTPSPPLRAAHLHQKWNSIKTHCCGILNFGGNSIKNEQHSTDLQLSTKHGHSTTASIQFDLLHYVAFCRECKGEHFISVNVCIRIQRQVGTPHT